MLGAIFIFQNIQFDLQLMSEDLGQSVISCALKTCFMEILPVKVYVQFRATSPLTSSAEMGAKLEFVDLNTFSVFG